MKNVKWMAVLAAMLLAVSLSACGSSSDTQAEEEEQAEVEEILILEEEEEEEEAEAEAEEPEEEAEEAEEAEEEAEAEAEAEDALTAEEVAQYIGESAAVLEAAIGEPNSKTYESSCIGSGEDGIWEYDGFTVVTYREGDSEVVDDVY